MSDPVTSGDFAATASQAAPAGSFGAKGSGLARGKRPSPAAVSTAAPAAPSGYQPSALEVIRPQSEYKNPFTGETSVAAPVVNEPAPQAAPAPVAPIAFVAPAPVIVAAPAPVAVQPVAAPVATPSAPADELFPFTPPAAERARTPVAPAPKAELNILPTEEVKRPAVSWGETSSTRRDERPTFKPERRDARPFEPRDQREPRRESAPASPSAPRESFSRDQERSTPVPAPAAKKSGGFLAWLKGLFGGATAPEVKTGERDAQGRDGQHRHEGGGRRRHRGGRGRNNYQGGGENRGSRDHQPRDPRDYPEGGQAEGSSGEQRFEGGGRRRRRGGRNRNHDDRGPRPEGQQGGGAI